MKNILVTGGAGYIGSHTVIDLIKHGFKAIVVDDYSNSSPKCIDQVRKICDTDIPLYNFDLRDANCLDELFKSVDIDAVVHFAGYKAVGESVAKPLKYYDNNLKVTITLLETMASNGVHDIVFSSSATVYGTPKVIPISESEPRGEATNPYARTKIMIEQMLEDLCVSSPEWNVTVLRYFNPLGADQSGDIGEDPNGIPNNLAPLITQVAIGKRDRLEVFGDDYNTPDGTCIRDYVHVVDLARGHTDALNELFARKKHGFQAINLGSGIGYSVMDIIHAYQEVIGKKVPYTVVGRRPGDIDESCASIDKAERVLGWRPKYDLRRMCEDSWRWQRKHPNGFADEVR
jgi:UDP-glucose 4-epimerase